MHLRSIRGDPLFNPAAERMARSLEELNCGNGGGVLKDLCSGILKTAKSADGPIHRGYVDLREGELSTPLLLCRGRAIKADP